MVERNQLKRELEAVYRDPESTSSAKIKALEILARLEGEERAERATVADDGPADPMADLDELDVRRRSARPARRANEPLPMRSWRLALARGSSLHAFSRLDGVRQNELKEIIRSVENQE
jgi:hypothetical protein